MRPVNAATALAVWLCTAIAALAQDAARLPLVTRCWRGSRNPAGARRRATCSATSSACTCSRASVWRSMRRSPALSNSACSYSSTRCRSMGWCTSRRSAGTSGSSIRAASAWLAVRSRVAVQTGQRAARSAGGGSGTFCSQWWPYGQVNFRRGMGYPWGRHPARRPGGAIPRAIHFLPDEAPVQPEKRPIRRHAVVLAAGF